MLNKIKSLNKILLYFRLCPIFQVSNVNGENLDLLKMFLNLLTTRMTSHDNEPAEFQIDDTYSVPVSDPKNIIMKILAVSVGTLTLTPLSISITMHSVRFH